MKWIWNENEIIDYKTVLKSSIAQAWVWLYWISGSRADIQYNHTHACVLLLN